MNYTQTDENVRLDMTRGEFLFMLLLIGQATGMAERLGDEPMKRQLLQLANDLNRGNSNFDQYELSKLDPQGPGAF